jgi:hypothetical protein
VPAGVDEFFDNTAAPGSTLLPRVLATARLHFVDKAAGVDAWQTSSWLAPFADSGAGPDWSAADVTEGELKQNFSSHPPQGAQFAEAPAAALRAQSYANWQKQLATHIYESQSLTGFRCAAVGLNSAPGGSESEFRAHLALALREKRDAEIDRLRRKYAPRLTTLEDQIRRARDRIERERSQLSQQKMQTAISVGTSILGALLGRRKLSATNVGRVGSAARSAGRIGQESQDVSRAEESREVIEQRLQDLQNELESETSRLGAEFDPATVEIERVEVKPRKTDIEVGDLTLAWIA